MKDSATANASQDTNKPAIAKGSSPEASSPSETEWVLRPFWQRLGLTTCQLLVGAIVGGAILAARDRFVWRLHVFHRENLGFSSSPQSKNTVKSRSGSSNSNQSGTMSGSRWLRVETINGRKKEFPMQHCNIGAGRDDTEMFLNIQNVRGHYLLGMKGASILGQSDTNLKLLQSRLMEAWYGGAGRRVAIDRGGWTGGPVTMGGR